MLIKYSSREIGFIFPLFFKHIALAPDGAYELYAEFVFKFFAQIADVNVDDVFSVASAPDIVIEFAARYLRSPAGIEIFKKGKFALCQAR